MDAGRVPFAVLTVVLVIVYAAGSAWWVRTGDAWYQELDRPAWQPPDVVFGLIWPYNFVVIVAAGIAVAAHGSAATRWIWVCGLTLSVLAALIWARRFYVDHALWSAAVALVVATAATVPIVVAAFTVRTWAGVLLLPYQVWLALAASLSIGYARLN